jgi:hypothetical protein
VRLVVAPPSGATFVSATGGVTPAGGTLTFNIGALANGARAVVTVVVRPLAPGSFVSSATVSANEPDPAMGDSTSSLTVAAVDRTGPTISKVLLPNPKAKTTPLVLTFNEDLDPARAASLANYRLVTAGRDKKFGTRDDKVVALRSASYNPTARTVTLLPRKKLSASIQYRLMVNGTSAGGVTDSAGNLLDGDRDGRVSGNYVAIVRLTRTKGRPRS